MTIEEAKTEIKRAVSIYLRKDDFGNYRIPVEKQRPVFMIGAPGIGKTAIMEQIAKELDLALVSYSMTHHTRQSAIGLPFIVHRNYGGEEAEVSEYTMSEIVASVYNSMEKSRKREGILFLDEINCVSETLAPSMLQFLQYKTFGNHRIPEGWVVVSAGNPPEYNRSVREFDIVTLDRLKVLDIEPDYETWKSYADEKGLHRAVRTYLDVRREDFYVIDSGREGKSYVTARGWEDLSSAICLYEEMGYPVDIRLVGQYLRHRRIAGEFATYYELYEKYRSDYRIRDILAGERIVEIEERARSAPFDERITLTELLLEGVIPDLVSVTETEKSLRRLLPALRELKNNIGNPSEAPVIASLGKMEDDTDKEILRLEAEHGLTAEEKRILQYSRTFAEFCRNKIRQERKEASDQAAFSIIRKEYDLRVKNMKEEGEKAEKRLRNLFLFIERNFGDSNEMLAAVTELTVNPDTAVFVAEHGPEEYYRYQKRFMLYERNQELMMKVRKLGEHV